MYVQNKLDLPTVQHFFLVRRVEYKKFVHRSVYRKKVCTQLVCKKKCLYTTYVQEKKFAHSVAIRKKVCTANCEQKKMLYSWLNTFWRRQNNFVVTLLISVIFAWPKFVSGVVTCAFQVLCRFMSFQVLCRQNSIG